MAGETKMCLLTCRIESRNGETKMVKLDLAMIDVWHDPSFEDQLCNLYIDYKI